MRYIHDDWRFAKLLMIGTDKKPFLEEVGGRVENETWLEHTSIGDCPPNESLYLSTVRGASLTCFVDSESSSETDAFGPRSH